MIGNELQDLLAGRSGFIVLAFLDANRGQGNQGLRKARVLALGALKDERRFFQPARGPQVVAEHDRVFGRELPFSVEHAQIRDGEVVSSGGGIGDGPCAPGHGQTRILLEHRGQLAYGKFGLRPRRGHAAIELRQKTNAVFGVAERAPAGRDARPPLT